VAVEPWFTPEQWTPGHLHAVCVDEDDLKVARISRAEPLSDPLTLTFHYLVGTPDGVEHFTEDHLVGMFDDAQYRGALEAAGLRVDHDPDGLMGRGLYLGLAPS
jgi:hypothetical protein